MPFDSLTLNAGAGGSSLAMDSFTDTDALTKVMPYGAVAFGALNGPYAPVTLTTGLPVAPQTGATWAVTGTFWQATQPVSVAGTVAVSAASLPLPAGAATAALQTPLNSLAAAIESELNSVISVEASGAIAIGARVAMIGGVQASVGTVAIAAAAADPGSSAIGLVVRNIPSGTQPVSGTFWQATQPVSGTVTANAGTGTFTIQSNASVNVAQVGGSALALGQQLAAASVPVVLTAAQLTTLTPLSSVAATQSGTWNVATVTTLTTCATVTSLTQFNGNAISTGNGVSGTGVLRVTLASDSTGQVNAVQSGTWNVGTVTTLTTCSTVTNLAQLGGQAVAMGTGARSAGTQRVTIATDDVVPASQSGTWTVQPGNTANTTPWLVTPAPAASGGPTASRVKSAATTNATNLKGSAGQVYGWALFNNTASAKYLKFYNSASAPTAGSGTPAFTVLVPANSGANVEFSMGVPFGTGIGYTITGAIADADTTATAADDVHGVILWK